MVAGKVSSIVNTLPVFNVTLESALRPSLLTFMANVTAIASALSAPITSIAIVVADIAV